MKSLLKIQKAIYPFLLSISTNSSQAKVETGTYIHCRPRDNFCKIVHIQICESWLLV